MSVAVAQPSHNPPDPITLNDLAALADGDENHRYELSAEGVLQVMSPPSFENQSCHARYPPPDVRLVRSLGHPPGRARVRGTGRFR